MSATNKSYRKIVSPIKDTSNNSTNTDNEKWWSKESQGHHTKKGFILQYTGDDYFSVQELLDRLEKEFPGKNLTKVFIHAEHVVLVDNNK